MYDKSDGHRVFYAARCNVITFGESSLLKSQGLHTDHGHNTCYM